MRALIFGKTGQVATELARRVPDGVTPVFLGRDRADLGQPDACAAAIRDVDLVINAAAYTAVDQAETEETLATTINGAAPGAMARACAAQEIPFLHISTDYVFDGTGIAPWAETDAVAPLGAYGRSKLAGEQAIQAAGGRSAILRTSWVVSAHGANFVKTMLRLAQTRDRLTIVADQVGGPTAAGDIAAALWQMAERLGASLGTGLGAGQGSGIYHFSGGPDLSWAGFAREIFAQTGQQVEVVDIPSRDYPTPAKRPANSRLNCAKIAADFGISRPDWRQSLSEILKELS